MAPVSPVNFRANAQFIPRSFRANFEGFYTFRNKSSYDNAF